MIRMLDLASKRSWVRHLFGSLSSGYGYYLDGWLSW